jgi:hypothetical protein
MMLEFAFLAVTLPMMACRQHKGSAHAVDPHGHYPCMPLPPLLPTLVTALSGE